MTAKEEKKSTVPMKFTIFRPFKNMKEKEHRFNFIHYAFKYRFFLPVMKLADRFLGKYMVKKREDIPDEPYNKNFLLLWDTFEQAVEEWWFKFKNIENMDKKRKRLHIHYWVIREKIQWYWVPKFFLRFALTMMLEDTAYREQFNFMLHTLHENLNKTYDPGREHKHIMYSGAHDMNIGYFIEHLQQQANEGKLGGGSAGHGLPEEINLKIKLKQPSSNGTVNVSSGTVKVKKKKNKRRTKKKK